MTETREEDAPWIERALRDHEQSLLRYAASLLGDRERARDVVQDTFLRLCRQPRHKVDRGLKTWLFTTCRRRALDVRRKEQRMHATAPASFDRRTQPADGPAEHAQRDEHAALLLSRLDDLPDKHREVIRLKFGQGMSYREIAEVTGHQVGYVGYLLHHGLANLREACHADRQPVP